MFFSYLARIVAILLLGISVLHISVALLIATEVITPGDAALAKYLPPYPTTGAAIDAAVHRIGIAIAFGTLAEISFALRNLFQRT